MSAFSGALASVPSAWAKREAGKPDLILSRMPLMKAPELLVEKRLPNSMASLMATLGGMSSRKTSSKVASRNTLRSITAMRPIFQF